MRVMLTGGSRFVGNHCVVALLKRGHDVRLMTRSREMVEQLRL